GEGICMGYMGTSCCVRGSPAVGILALRAVIINLLANQFWCDLWKPLFERSCLLPLGISPTATQVILYLASPKSWRAQIDPMVSQRGEANDESFSSKFCSFRRCRNDDGSLSRDICGLCPTGRGPARGRAKPHR